MKTSREDLIVTALHLFLSKGYDKTSMMDLARTAGVSKGAFHHYFPRKDDLLRACLDHFFGDFLAGSVDATGALTLQDFAHATADRYAQSLIRLQENAIPLPAFQAFLWDQLRGKTEPLYLQQLATAARLSDLIQADHPTLSEPAAQEAADQLLAMIEGTGTLISIAPDLSAADITARFQTAVDGFLSRL